MSGPDDGTLVARCRNGDSRSFDALVDRYQQPLYRLVLRMVGNPEDVLDLTQTAFLKAYEKLDTYHSGSKFFSWIYRIALNEGINFTERRRAQSRRHDRIESESVAMPEDPFSTASEPEDGIQGALMDLTVEYRIAIILRHFLDLPYRQMAEVLGIPEKTVKSRLFSARRLMRDFLLSQTRTLPGHEESTARGHFRRP